ncbi:P-loop containing nucleoside triphosphate hydrolase protein [Elaphomyces granulatus]
MRLLKCDDTGEFSLDLVSDNARPPYAILSHTWGADAEEVSFKDMIDGTGTSKSGYDKIRFCGEQVGYDKLQYFWIDTCCIDKSNSCIDKSNSTELQAAINSMFRWYRNAAKCYVYLADVSRPALGTDSKPSQPPRSWESSFRKSRWFTRGWTLQELVAPALVEFFSKEGERLGNKRSLERHIHEVTGIPVKALRDSSLSDFSVPERMSWAESRDTTHKEDSRDTTHKEDKAYSLLGIFDVHMPLIYGEGGENAFKRLREEIDRGSKGINREDFSVAFSLCNVPEIEQFVAREEELAEMHRMLRGDGSRRTVVLHGLGGVGKTQLTIAYAKRHKDSYSAVFWLNIKDEDSLIIRQSFAKAAKQIVRDHPSARRLSSVDIKEDLDGVIDAVKEWLSLPNNTRWLMIYDNYDNPKLPGNPDPAAVNIRKFLPESYQGSVIITTRSPQVEIGRPIQIRKLEDVLDDVKILSNASRREGLMDDADAIKLAEELDGLPLALATAGAYLSQTALKQSELSANLLRFWAYFDNQDIWFELLRHADPEDPEWIHELTEDELSFNGAVQVLSDHGLVEVNMSSQELIESRGYGLHACVHSWIVNVLNQEWDPDLAKLALKFVGSHVPQEESAKWWLTQRQLLQHAARCSHALFNGMVTDDGIAWELNNLGYLYSCQNQPGVSMLAKGCRRNQNG